MLEERKKVQETSSNSNSSNSISICLIALRFQLFIAFTERKKEDTIQYGYRTWGTHARVFSQTLTHGNSKNELR